MLLWPFNKYPGTDYETFNWEWILKTVKDYTEKVDDFIANITETWNAFRAWTTGEIDQMHDDFANYVNVTEGALNTGAIADGAITKPKIDPDFLLEIENVYAIPEEYGAVGDGVTDDTQAFIDALTDNDVLLIPPDKTYKIGTVNLSHGKHILGDGTIRVDGDGFVFNCPTESKSFRNIKFETNDSPCITTTGLSEDSAHGTLEILNVTFSATDNTTQVLHIGADTDANIDGCIFRSCGMDNVDSINTNVTNCLFNAGYYGIYYANTNSDPDRAQYACGLRVTNTTFIGCTIGLKSVQCDSLQIDNCMIDYDDYPVIILGTSGVDITNCYITSRQGNTAVYIARNNNNSGILGGNGFSTEAASDIRIDNNSIYQHDEALTNPTIYISGSQWVYITNLSIGYAGKSGIELRDTGHVIVENARINSTVPGSMALLSFRNNVLEDDSSHHYDNIITALPVFVHYAMAGEAGSTYRGKFSGTRILSPDETDVTINTSLPSGVQYAFLTTSSPLTINYYTPSGADLRLITGTHTGSVRVNWLVYANPNNSKFTLNDDGSVAYAA